MKQRSPGSIEESHRRPTSDRGPIKGVANKRLPKQIRKQLGKHYASKYRAGRG